MTDVGFNHHFHAARRGTPATAHDSGLRATAKLAGLAGLIGFSALLLAPFHSAEAADHGQLGPTSPDVKAWAGTLENKLKEGCCSTADGWKPEEVEYDIKENKYRVRIDGEWYDVPADAVIHGPNRFGFAVVWYYRSWLDGIRPSVSIRCFIPGAGG
jgi:hypothetical protein